MKGFDCLEPRLLFSGDGLAELRPDAPIDLPSTPAIDVSSNADTRSGGTRGTPAPDFQNLPPLFLFGGSGGVRVTGNSDFSNPFPNILYDQSSGQSFGLVEADELPGLLATLNVSESAGEETSSANASVSVTGQGSLNAATVTMAAFAESFATASAANANASAIHNLDVSSYVRFRPAGMTTISPYLVINLSSDWQASYGIDASEPTVDNDDNVSRYNVFTRANETGGAYFGVNSSILRHGDTEENFPGSVSWPFTDQFIITGGNTIVYEWEGVDWEYINLTADPDILWNTADGSAFAGARSAGVNFGQTPVPVNTTTTHSTNASFSLTSEEGLAPVAVIATMQGEELVAVGSTLQINLGSSLVLSGDLSEDPDEKLTGGDPTEGIIQYRWYRVSEHGRELVSTNTTGELLIDGFDKPGALTYELEVVDDEFQVGSESITVNVELIEGAYLFADFLSETLSPESNFISLSGTAPANTEFIVRLLSADCSVTRTVTVMSDANGDWEQVLHAPSGTAHVALYPSKGTGPSDWAFVTIRDGIIPLEELPESIALYEELQSADVLLSTSPDHEILDIFGRNASYIHAWIFVGSDEFGTPEIAQAPGPGKSSEVIPLDQEARTQLSIDLWRSGVSLLEDRQEISDAARKLADRPYWDEFEAVGLYANGYRYWLAQSLPEPIGDLSNQRLNEVIRRLQELVSGTDQLICSTLVWHAYRSAGINIASPNMAPPSLDFFGVTFGAGYFELLAKNNALLVPDTIALSGVLQQVVIQQ